jgi:L-amino acid N-acyltransferase YncA
MASDRRCGGVQGYAYAAPFRDLSAYRFTLEDSIYIDADRQRYGYGMRLLPDLIASYEAIGKRQMIAVIGGFQSAGSIGLHNRMGFETPGFCHRRAASLATGRIQC